MQKKVYPDFDSLSRATADLIADIIRATPSPLVCIASGHSPVGVFKSIIDDVREGKLDLSNTTFISLDEWIGIDPADPGSCIAMLRNDFFNHLTLREDQVVMFDITKSDLESECDRINEIIAAHGGLDVMLVGIGLNGHIGMNEPGTSFDTYAHISTLADETITTGQKYFKKATVLSKGITLGIRHFREAKLPIVIANGFKKAPIIASVLGLSANEKVPASVVHKIDQAYLMIDQEAASYI